MSKIIEKIKVWLIQCFAYCVGKSQKEAPFLASLHLYLGEQSTSWKCWCFPLITQNASRLGKKGMQLWRFPLPSTYGLCFCRVVGINGSPHLLAWPADLSHVKYVWGKGKQESGRLDQHEAWRSVSCHPTFHQPDSVVKISIKMTWRILHVYVKHSHIVSVNAVVNKLLIFILNHILLKVDRRLWDWKR